jgi:hypothetical protein
MARKDFERAAELIVAMIQKLDWKQVKELFEY